MSNAPNSPPSTPIAPAPNPTGPGPLRRAVRLLGRFLTAVLGTYQPPAWLAWLWRVVTWPVHAFSRWAQRAPRAAWGTVVAAGLLAVVGQQGWMWWKARPQPKTVEVTVSQPRATPLEERATPEPLAIRFGESAAPVDAVGKALAEGLGVKVRPELAGTWTWETDTLLQFVPKEDWPVGKTFDVELLEGLVPEHVLLGTRSLRFQTAALSCQLTGSQFFQDPVDTKDKRAVVGLSFSHPVDAAELQKRVHLTLREPQSGMRPDVLKPLPFRITYDKFKGVASVQSDRVAIPNLDAKVEVVVDPGVRSSRVGTVANPR